VWDLADVKTSASGQTLHILAGHPDRVFSCAFSPDGQWVASGSYQTVYLWNLDTDGNEKACQILTGHTNAVKCVAFSSDGRLLISSGFDQTVRLWKVPEGQALGALPAQHTIVTSLAFHPQGALLAMGATDHTVHLWELPTKRLLTKLRGHTNNVECVRFSADGQWLASAGADETVKLWETAAIRAGRAACRQTLHAPGPYAGMDITGVTGISAAQKAALKTLGAVDKQSDQDAAKIASGSSITER
jgi:WD40 repeat protein